MPASSALQALLAARCASGLERFRNLHRGSTCYIFGDGPSVKWFDLSRFSDAPAICCGLLPFHKDFNRLDVRYLLTAEPWAFVPPPLQPNVPSLRLAAGVIQAYRRLFASHRDKRFFVHVTNVFNLRGPNISYVFRRLPAVDPDVDARLRKFDVFAGSFYGSLSLALLMGFRRAYLVGFDAWTLTPARRLHWYEVGNGSIFEADNFARDFLAALQERMEIVTVGREGTSPNVKYVDYESLTGVPARFQENWELMSQTNLRTLATYPPYKIFNGPGVDAT